MTAELTPGRRGRAGWWRPRVSAAEAATAGAAWLLIAAAGIAVRWPGFGALAPLLGRRLGPVGYVPLTTAAQTARAAFVRQAIERAARRARFRADCLPQAIAGLLLCRALAVPAALTLGVRLGGEPKPRLEAHAWLTAGRIAITGGQSASAFRPVACFLHEQG